MTSVGILRFKACLVAGVWLGIVFSGLSSTAKGDGFRSPDGTVQIVGIKELKEIVEGLCSRLPSHPNIQYRSGNDLAALQSMVFGSSAFAPVSNDFLTAALGPQRIVAHAEPFGVRIAHASVNPGARISPLAIVVRRDNPLVALTTGQVERIFTVGDRSPALTCWGQLGVVGIPANADIHPYGLPESDHYPSEDESFADYLFLRKFGGVSATLGYRRVPTYAEVAKQVAADPLGIGITTLSQVGSTLKVIAVSGDVWRPPSAGSASDIAAGRYPYDRYLYVFVRREPGKPLDPLAKQFLELALSAEGQALIAEDAHGFLPLNPTERSEELAKLE